MKKKKCNWGNKIVQEFNSRIKKLQRLIIVNMLVCLRELHLHIYSYEFLMCTNAIYCRNIRPKCDHDYFS